MATVMISVPDALTELRKSSGDLCLPVPVISLELKLTPAIVRVSSLMTWC